FAQRPDGGGANLRPRRAGAASDQRRGGELGKLAEMTQSFRKYRSIFQSLQLRKQVVGMVSVNARNEQRQGRNPIGGSLRAILNHQVQIAMDVRGWLLAQEAQQRSDALGTTVFLEPLRD